ncbi:MAG: hypothetical protein KatS3mg015_1221 [Fimbriimonadales bacterium]|nr:MAG: hypothetical protein KatS3mg015_1221 [Fimbriimonadales bacterium]
MPFYTACSAAIDLAEHTYAHSTGTTVLHLSKDAVPSYQLRAAAGAPCADVNHLRQKPLLSESTKRQHESRTLAALRDALLPKLISGELRVKDAERFVESVGV